MGKYEIFTDEESKIHTYTPQYVWFANHYLYVLKGILFFLFYLIRLTLFKRNNSDAFLYLFFPFLFSVILFGSFDTVIKMYISGVNCQTVFSCCECGRNLKLWMINSQVLFNKGCPCDSGQEVSIPNNWADDELSLVFSIDNHNLLMIATDGRPFEPYEVSDVKTWFLPK